MTCIYSKTLLSGLFQSLKPISQQNANFLSKLVSDFTIPTEKSFVIDLLSMNFMCINHVSLVQRHKKKWIKLSMSIFCVLGTLPSLSFQKQLSQIPALNLITNVFLAVPTVFLQTIMVVLCKCYWMFTSMPWQMWLPSVELLILSLLYMCLAALALTKLSVAK